MKLTVNHLQQIVKRVASESASLNTLRSELARALGTALVTEGTLEDLAARSNYQLEVLQRTGKEPLDFVKPSVALRFAEHKNPEVRKLVVRLLPERFLHKFVNDEDGAVRALVAKRVSMQRLHEMTRRFEDDDELWHVYKGRQINEGGHNLSEGTESDNKSHDEDTDTANFDTPTMAAVTKRDDDYEGLGDAVKQDEGIELSETYYNTLAHKMIQDYDSRVIESNWRTQVVKRYASSMRATNGVVLDEKKLLDAINAIIEENDDFILEKGENYLRENVNQLKNTISRLYRKSFDNSAFMPIIDEDNHPAKDLLLQNLTPSQFIEQVNAIYAIRESSLPAAIRKFRIGEGKSSIVNVPVVGKTPGNRVVSALDERIMDSYCKHWNNRQALVGEPIKLKWNCAPHSQDAIGFQIELK